MPVNSITTHRFNMKADVLKQGQYIPDPIDPEAYGEWVDEQDPLTGEIVRVWQPYPDNTNTPDVNENVTFGTIRCLARGIVDGGIRVAGTTERFGDAYENREYIKMWVTAKVILTKRDRITNVRNRCNQIIWVDEEFDTLQATTFNINGVTPLFDAFNRHVENFLLLERAD